MSFSNSVCLHIGLSKTGTTACQHAFDLEREALRRAGLLYPRSGIEACHHFHIAQAFLSGSAMADVERQSILAGLSAEAHAESLPVLLSSEHFSDAGDADIAAIARFFGDDLTIAVSLRNQVDWASAMYAEAIRWGFRMGFEDFLDRSVAGFDYEVLLRRWERVCGRGRIQVIPYDVHRDDIGREVLRVAGLDATAAAAIGTDRRVHQTLSAPAVHLQYELSEDLGNGQALESGLRRLEESIRASGLRLPKTWCIPASFSSAMLRLEASNSRIAEAYGLPRPLFGQPLDHLIEQNRLEGYAAPSFAAWMLDSGHPPRATV